MISSVGSSGPANLLASPLEGMRRGMRQAEQANEGIENGDDLPENMANLVEATVLVKANSIAARTADELIGSLLNTKA
jgi:hypothetical protein